MPKKKKKTDKNLFENFEVEPVKENDSETESVSSEDEAVLPEVISDADEDVQPEKEDEPSSEDISLDDIELSADDLLDDVRRSLIEENAEAEEKKKPSLYKGKLLHHPFPHTGKGTFWRHGELRSGEKFPGKVPARRRGHAFAKGSEQTTALSAKQTTGCTLSRPAFDRHPREA